MQSFTALEKTLSTVPSDVVMELRRIDLAAGSEELYRHQLPEVLESLAQRARGESITASSAIEGVVAPADRAQAIIAGHPGQLRNRDEQQLAGYREALDYLFTEDWRPLNVGLLLHLHRLLWSRTELTGGNLKDEDNLVVDRASDGSMTVRFRPVPAHATEFHLEELVHRYNAEAETGRHHPVLLIGLFVLDLTVIHPFADGNGRVARLIANAMLSDAGYRVGRWVSLEQVIAESADLYYSSLRDSTTGWHEQQADVWPWLRYFVGTVASAYARFTRRVNAPGAGDSKQVRVRRFIDGIRPASFRVADIRASVPGVSDNTIRLVLATMRAEGAITNDGLGRTSRWRHTE